MNLSLSRKKVTVAGLGRSGLSAALLLQQLGAQIKVTDWGDSEELRINASLLRNRGIDVELGKHSESFVRGSDLLIVSPGVSRDSPLLIWAEAEKIPIISEIEFAYLHCPAPIVAITGTNGKTTVTTLLGEILNNAKRKAIVCGNIGRPFSGEILKGIGSQHMVVLEVSSFQLERIVRFRPRIAVLLNISEDHLDRYRDFDEYFKTKTLIFSNQKEADWAVLNYKELNLRKLVSNAKSKVKFFGEDKMNQNYSAVLAVGSILGISKHLMLDVIDKFKGIEHRLEYVDTIGGVKFINDSKATNTSSTIWALEQLTSPIILIAGGREKGSNFEPVVRLIAEKVKAVVLIGEARQNIKKVLANKVLIRQARSLDEAVLLTKQISRRGDSVLFSPMCASFDMFKDFEERGRKFKEIVKRLCEANE